MTDRGERALSLSQDRLQIGPSAMGWEEDGLTVEINEISTPHGQRIKGRVRILPAAVTDVELPLTPEGTHIWRPFAPAARIEVALNRPGWTWSGHGYFDANFGTRALEQDFGYWTWGRFPVPGGAACFYDIDRLDGSTLARAFRFGEDGSVSQMNAPPKARIRRSPWMVRRETRCDAGSRPRPVKAMLDAPFYNRVAVETTIHGVQTVGVHESLDLRKFRSPLLKPMLAVRVPRRPGWPGWI